tara:strand:+ start:851 stop:1072 length:222 start_codon:yes stop_codon:yes gene_type:complete
MYNFIELSNENRYGENKRNVWVKAEMLLSKFQLENINSDWLCIGSIIPTDDDKENHIKMYTLYNSINKKGEPE